MDLRGQSAARRLTPLSIEWNRTIAGERVSRKLRASVLPTTTKAGLPQPHPSPVERSWIRQGRRGSLPTHPGYSRPHPPPPAPWLQTGRAKRRLARIAPPGQTPARSAVPEDPGPPPPMPFGMIPVLAQPGCTAMPRRFQPARSARRCSSSAENQHGQLALGIGLHRPVGTFRLEVIQPEHTASMCQAGDVDHPSPRTGSA